MDILEIISKRRSIRKYCDIPIPKEILADLLIAGQNAPCAGNFQNCRLIVIDEEYIKDQISDACLRQTWMKSAPVFIAIIAETDSIEKMYGSRGKSMYSIQNASAIAQNILLTATDRGLASCWVSAFNDDKISQSLNLTSNQSPQIIIPLGYADEVVPKPPKIELRAFAYVNSFGGIGRINEFDFLFKDYANFVETHVKKGAKSVRGTFKRISDIAYRKIEPHIEKIKRQNKRKKDSKFEPPISRKKQL